MVECLQIFLIIYTIIIVIIYRGIIKLSIWLFRAGSNGEYENKFISDNRVYLTWDDLDINLKQFSSRKIYMNYWLINII